MNRYRTQQYSNHYTDGKMCSPFELGLHRKCTNIQHYVESQLSKTATQTKTDEKKRRTDMHQHKLEGLLKYS